MFGSFRFMLAWMVVLSHLWTRAALWAGPYAVFGFYLLSGFLMAMVLALTYGSSIRGTLRFFANRVLRIYPPYLAAAGLTLLLLVLIPDSVRDLSRTMRIPETSWEWVRNLTIIGLNAAREGPAPSPSLVPPAWSIDIELCFYMLLGFGIARGPRLALIWLLMSLIWSGWLIAEDAPFPHRYSTLAAASMPFSLGACIYHFRLRVAGWFHHRWHLALALGLFVTNAAVPDLIWGPVAFDAEQLNPEFRRLGNSPAWKDIFVFGFYASLFFSAYCITALAQLDPRRVAPRWSRIDRSG